MKFKNKLCAGLLLCLPLLVCSKPIWFSIGESAESHSRIVVDVTSINLRQSSVSASFVQYYKGNSLKFSMKTSEESCINGYGEIHQLVYLSNTSTRINTYWWSANGDKLYDAAGAAMCALYPSFKL